MISVTLPQLSLSMEEGKVARWLVADGERVSAGQPIVEIETDKATMEVEAPAAGVIHLIAPEGAVLAIETMLAEIGDGNGAAAPPRRPPAGSRPSAASSWAGSGARVRADGSWPETWKGRRPPRRVGPRPRRGCATR